MARLPVFNEFSSLMIMVDDKKRKVARGSTLFRPNEEAQAIKESKVERLKNKPERDAKKKFIKPVHISLKKYPDEKNIDKIIDYINENGIQIKDYKRKYIVRRIRSRVSKNQFDTYMDYLKFISSNKSEFRELKESLSINVTRFIRNRDTFDLIKKEIMPIVAQNARKSKIKMWSAGCAVGAEAYSMSMLMDGINVPYTITATDLKTELLNLARGGFYDKIYLAEMKPEEKSKYFDLIDPNTYKVKAKYRLKVNFSKMDLLADKYPVGFDVVFCRNVLIYIERAAQEKMLQGFVTSLKPGGFLVLGRTESIFNTKILKYLSVYSSKHRIYRKDKLIETENK